MGKGDKRTKRGKIIAGSYGKSRPKPSGSYSPQEGDQKKETKTTKKKGPKAKS